uniref:Chemokine interleukin-8-like domain-containing protein n=1 Tax=Denticeps clupeoides TaxID=299321 RepID=A0AAY4AQ53_9TELE
MTNNKYSLHRITHTVYYSPSVPTVKCCTKYSTSPLPLGRIRGFKEDIPGLFITVLGRVICANPKDQWVKHAIEHVR